MKYTKEEVVKLLEEVMNFGMGLRQEQLNGSEERLRLTNKENQNG